jgi:tetratricopeptide (TPR) repeat protein
LFTARRAAHLARLRIELDNIRAALVWSVSDGGDAALGQIVAGDLRDFWVMANCLLEGAAALRAVLAHGGPPLERATALSTFGLVHWFLGEHEQAAGVLEESLALFKGLGRERDVARTLQYLAVANESRGRHAEALRLIAESAALHLRTGDEHGHAFALVSAVEPDDLDQARRDCEEALTVLRAHGDDWGASRALRNLGVVAYRGGDFAEARRRFGECLRLQRELGSRWLIARSLNTLGDIARCEDDLAAAQSHYEGSRAEERADGSRANAAWSLAGLGHVALARGDRERAEELFVEALSVRPISSEKSEHVASSLVGLAEARRLAGDDAGAAEMLRILAPLIEEAHRRMPPVDVTSHRRCLDAIRSGPGSPTLEPSPGDPSLSDLVRRMCEARVRPNSRRST